MSRRSLENHHGRVHTMIQSNPTEESFLRSKFLSTNYTFQKRSADLQYDSADEVDVSDLRRSLQVRRKPENNIIGRFFLMVINYMYNFSSSVKRTFTGSNQRYTYTPIRKQHGKHDKSVIEAPSQFIFLQESSDARTSPSRTSSCWDSVKSICSCRLYCAWTLGFSTRDRRTSERTTGARDSCCCC